LTSYVANVDANQIVEIIDPDGRLVRLDWEALIHIGTQHPEMRRHMGAVINTVADPDRRDPDPRLGRERYYKRGVGPSSWLFVVVDFNVPEPRVVTAYARRLGPDEAST
jgi:hypothetical protein